MTILALVNLLGNEMQQAPLEGAPWTSSIDSGRMARYTADDFLLGASLSPLPLQEEAVSVPEHPKSEA